MKKYLLLFLLMSAAAQVSAEYSRGLVIERIRLSGDVALFGTSQKPSGVCDHYGDYFRFDHTSDRGKSFLSLLLTAKARGAKIDVWYPTSSKAGKDESDGCYMSNVSSITGIAIRP